MGLIERDARHVWHPFTQHAIEPAPLAVVAAHGATLVLEDGRELIDGISSWWTCLHGHGRPELVRAMAEQAATLDHVLFAGTTHEPAVALAEELVGLAPPGLTRVFFSDNGSTAVEVALKIAYQAHVQRGHPERTVFVALEGGYHGDTFGSMSIGDPDPFFVPFRPLLFETRRVPPREDAFAEALARLGPRAAGVVLEPLVQGAAGMRMHGPGLVRAAREACDEHGLPLIADEVMTGFGRTGGLFACAVADVAPDLLCLAKGLTGGAFPMSVTIATESLYEAFLSTDRARAFFHGHSFTGNPIGCAVARASLRICRDEDVPERLNAIGKRIEETLRSGLPADGRPRATLRRTGGIVAFDLEPVPGTSSGPPSSGYLAARGLSLRGRAAQRGVLLRPLGDVLYAMPPAATSDEQCRAIGETLVELARDAGRGTG